MNKMTLNGLGFKNPQSKNKSLRTIIRIIRRN
jgi:hypothetical protein